MERATGERCDSDRVAQESLGGLMTGFLRNWAIRGILPLLLLGLFSVVCWIRTERQGRGDLRLYGLVQFLPMLLIPLIMVMYNAPESYIPYVVALLIFYLIAKVFELLDSVIYSWSHFISGHTLKHLFAAVGTFCLLLMLHGRGVM